MEIEEDYCEFLRRSEKVVEDLLEDWDNVDKDDLKARIQLYLTAVTSQIARHCPTKPHG